MGTLSSELTPIVAKGASRPRVYADANIPNGIVAFMRTELQWDVFFVLEHDDLRRARDIEHYRLARRLGRTIVTQDRDYIDDAGFPPDEGAGVLIFSAPDDLRFRNLLTDVDATMFRVEGASPLPVEGRKVLVQLPAQ